MRQVRISMALLALLMWSASLLAQGNDPFPSVNVHKYSDNMTILGQVKMNDRVLGEGTVIAVYQGDEIRGKGIPFSKDEHENIFYFNVYGEKDGEPLHFRVFTDGDIIEVDQGLTYETDAEVGSPSDYYIVNLPDNQTTQIRGIDAPSQSGAYYDLSGRKTTVRKGQILIANGRKILQR